MATTSRSAAARLTSLVVSALLLVGAQLLSVAPKAYAADPGTISGKVLDSANGLPLANVAITEVGSLAPPVLTDANGDYTVTAVAGDHTLTATLADYVPRSSARITVADGTAVSGVNFTLQRVAYVQGTVTSGAGTGIAGVLVKLFDATTTSADPAYTVTTDGTGTFALADLVPGSYKVQFDASQVAYMTQWYYGVSTRDQAEVVSLASGGATDLSATLVKASSVSGIVKDESGTPISGAQVTLFRHGAPAATMVATNASGQYVIGSVAAADQYTIQVQAAGLVTTWYGDQVSAATAENFALLDSSDLALRDIVVARGGSISGSMTPGDVAFSYVTASSPLATYNASVSTSTGTYLITGLPAGTYAVTFHANGYVPKTVSGVTVTVGATASASATLAPVGVVGGTTCTISGKVTDLGGGPLADITVQSNSTSGAFTKTGPDGSYTLVASSLDDQLLYLGDGYVSQTRGSSCAMATPRADVRLSRVVTILGTVTTSAGPLAGASVWVYEAAGGLVASATTAADGTYQVTNLAEGTYTVGAFKDVAGDTTYPQKFYPSGSSLAGATYFQASEGETAADVDITLFKSASISGFVTMSDGSSTLGAQVTVWGGGLVKTSIAGADGAYSVGGLPGGTYVVSAHLSSWSSTSIQVVLGEGVALTGQDVGLGNGVAVSGIVSRGGAPVAGVIAYLRMADGRLDSVTTDEGGQYVFRGVPPGTYTVGAALDSVVHYLGGVTKPAHATMFPVGTTPTTVDLVIPVDHAVAVSVQLPDASPAASGLVTATDAYGDIVAQAPVSSGVADLTLQPGLYRLAAFVDGYPSATASYTVGDDPNATTITLSVGASLTLAPDTGSAPVVAVVRSVATGLSSVPGSALVTGLAAGSYVVAYYPVDAEGSYCGPLTWYHGTGYVDAERVTVATGDALVLPVHATCVSPGVTSTVTATVTAPVPLAADRVDVEILDETGTYSARARIDDQGKVTFTGLAPGTYTLTATDGDIQLLDATAVVDASAGDAAVTLPMVLGGSVTGRVLDVFGHQVAALVRLAGPGLGASVNTPDGQFSLGALDTGDYTLVITPALPYAPVDLSPLHITRGAVSSIGTVTVQAGGRITGHLPEAYGVGTVTIDAVDASGRVLVSTSANPGLDYALWGVPAGPAYVRFSGYGLVTTWWKTGSSLATATPVQVVRNGAVAGVDPTLVAVAGPPTTTISGRVTGVDGPMAGVTVVAVGAASDSVFGTTTGDGTYTLTVPQNGAYEIRASFCVGAQGELGCYGQLITATTTATVGTTPATGVDLTFGTVPLVFTTTVPTILGLPVAGEVLTADAGTWVPQPDLLTYEWYAGIDPIPGATASTFTLTPAQVGKTITVRVTGAKTGYVTSTVTSLPTTEVTLPPEVIVAGTPVFSGVPTVGTPLTVDPGMWSPADVTLSYTWVLDGTPVTVAAGTYTPAAADLGKTLTVSVTGSKGTSTPVVAQVSGVVVAGTMTPGTVGISGTAAVGSTLTAATAGWQVGATLSYQWYRSGTLVPGSTAATYAVSLVDVASTLSVRVTGQLAGYASATVSSAESAVVPQPSVVAGTVTISGTPAVGATLTANAGSWTPTGVTLAYQWLRAGVAIPGATAVTYVPVAADAGQTLAVSVTGTLAGYTSATAVSAQTAPVTSATVVPGTVTIAGSPTVYSTLTAQPGTWSPTNLRFSYQWLRDGVAIRNANGPTYSVGTADLGHTLSVSVTGTRFGVGSATATSAPTAAVQSPRVVAGTVTISGTPAVGNRLSAQTGGWTPASVNLSYQWLRDGVAIGGQTGRRYTVTLSDVGHVLSVSVTGSRFGYVSATAVSAPTAVIAPARVVAGTVTILGSATVGSRLTSQLAGWAPTNANLSYQWFRDGVAVSGATGPSHTVGLAGVGHAFTLVVTGSLPGWTSATASSAPTAVVPRPVVTAGTALIVGRASNGWTLFAQTANWSPTDVTLSYQWLRDGVAIPGAVRFRYTLTSADVGRRISLAVTGTSPGYLPATVTTAQTAIVR